MMSEYKFFAMKPEGKVPCLAIGKQDDGDRMVHDNEEIVGIAFQPAASGRVKPVLPIESFAEINWPNAPTNNLTIDNPPYIKLNAPGLRPADIFPQWEDFAKTMRAAKEILLDLMTPEGDKRPKLLLKAFQKFAKRNPGHPFPATLGNVVKKAQTADWTDDSDILCWVEDAVIRGCSGNPSHALANCLKVLYPALKTTIETVVGEHLSLRVPPAETSLDKATFDLGVPHCLYYGFGEKSQPVEKYRPVLKEGFMMDSSDEEDSSDGAQGDAAGRRHRSRPRHRMLRPAKKQNRSRSRSPMSNEDEDVDLVDNVKYVGERQSRPSDITLRHMVNNPDDYLLATREYSKFFESHRPDLMCFKESEKSGQPIVAKFVCAISSWCREGEEYITIERHVEEITERCVHSCLATLACNQDSILGICVVVDGMKLIKVDKARDDSGHISYNITETTLVPWDDIDEMYVLLEMIRKEIVA